MSTLTMKNAVGADAGSVELAEHFFGIQPNVPVMHQVVTAQLAHRRAGTQSTKTRAEVAGGGAKPFKQKGTGNARQGSIRAPHYSGGGVALPTHVAGALTHTHPLRVIAQISWKSVKVKSTEKVITTAMIGVSSG